MRGDIYKIKYIINVYKKSNIQASEGKEDGLYPFYTSSLEQRKFCNEALYQGNAITMGTGGKASINYVADKFSTSTDCYNFTAYEYTKFIYYYLLYQLDKIDLIGFQGIGIKHLQKDFINNMKIYIPYSYKKIAQFLDNKVATIDNIIDKTKETIEDYKKYKQSLITEVVTKGLDKNAEMKDSGVEWIGKINIKFKIVDFKYLLTENMQYGANESGEIFNENLPRYIRITDIDENGNLKDEGKVSLSEDKAQKYILKQGDILFARSGATVGKSFIYNIEIGRSAFAGYLIKATVNKKILPKIIYYYTLSSVYEIWKNGIFIQSTIQNIGAEKYMNMPIIYIKNLTEQQKIVQFLDKQCTAIDNLISAKQNIIDELEQYKKSLIYEYVTGKKEVK